MKQSKAPLYISIGIIVAAVASYLFIPGVKIFFNEAWDILTSDNSQRIQRWIDQFGLWGPLVIIVAMVCQMFLLVIPTPLLMIVAMLAYGPVWGTVIVLIAISCASSVGYGIGAYFGRPVVTRLLGERSEKKVESFIHHYGFWAVIITRLTPFLSNDAISFVGGILRMGFWRFMSATLIGITPLTILIAYLGESYDRLKKGLIWASAITIVLFILYVWWDKRRSEI